VPHQTPRQARRHGPGWLALAIALAAGAGAAAPALAQEPPETVPPGAIREIRDLRYVVQDLASRVEDLRVRETDLELRLELAADVLFDFDKSNIKPEAETVLARAAGIIRERATGTVRIEGHTDGKGSDDYNLRLSDRRAAAVKAWLATKGGLGAMTFSTKGLGAKQPVAPNTKPDGSDDPDGRQRNRRVEIVIAKKG
jgi:outer membrane protein OmpA-like peptidoglycan-associated protein